MSEHRESWARAADLFDELAPLTDDQRRERLGAEPVPPNVRRWLDELLAAHDDERSMIIDRQVDALARSLAPDAPLLDASEYVGRRFGPWRADALIGRGGMGVVLGGRRDDGQFDMRVAIKLLDPGRFSGATVEAIRRELRMLAAVEHPGIARLIDGGVGDDGLPYVVMEFVEGLPITEWLAKSADVSSGLDLPGRLALFEQVAEAVAHCHDRMIVHGDIKPGNVLVDDSGRVRLLDFGIAHRLTGAGVASDRSWCSPGYAAPERLRGAPHAVAEDVFSLAALLHVLLTGQGIRSAPEQTRIAAGRREREGEAIRRPSERRRLRRAIRRAGGSSDDLDAIVLRALAADPEQRYRSVRELIGDLQAWRAKRPVTARRVGPVHRLRLWSRRHRAVAVGLAVAVLALVGGSTLALWQADRARDSARAAEMARSTAETALARAEAVNRFLVELFEARMPDLPPDQLPTTEQLVERGIEQALDPESGPPDLRAELLITLAEILAARRQLEDADGLLDEVGRLLEDGSGLDDALRLRLAVLRADNAQNHNRLDDADLRLTEAIELYRTIRPEDPMRRELERDRARVLMRRERFDEAEPLLLALQDEIEGRPAFDDLALRVAGDLAAVAGMTGRDALAFERFEAILERKKALDHPELSLATTEVNLAGLAQSLGRFDEALARFDAVIERLAPFTEVPRSVRAVALKGRADIARMRGEFDAAENDLHRAAEEWARVLDLASVEEDFFIHYYGARLAAARGRYEEAAARAEVAIGRLLASQEGPSHRIGALHADRARYLCRAGRFEEGDAMRVAAGRFEGQDVRDAEQEARAVCALLQDGSPVDPEWISEADLARLRAQRSDASEIARLELLRADLLEARGQLDEATALHAMARTRLQRVGARPDHPLLLRAERGLDR